MADFTINYEMMEALRTIATEKDIAFETIVDALANALVSAYKRRPNSAAEARVTIDPETGEYHMYAQDIDEETGAVLREWEDTPRDFGRIAAQTAKQVILQRIREAERDKKFHEYESRAGDMVTGIVSQAEGRYTILDLGKGIEALMPASEQIPYEQYRTGDRFKVLVYEVSRTVKGPQIRVSRSHPELVKRLFELEVPEIVSGVVEIREVAREGGHRTKIAVVSHDNNVDPVGACVGARGTRVRNVVNELRGEKVDIVQWVPDLRQFVANALSPAKVRDVRIDTEAGIAEVLVPDFQLSLAIGKEGQNARLAARLTKLRIDIRSDAAPVESRPPDAPPEGATGAKADSPAATPAAASDGGATTTTSPEESAQSESVE